MQQTGLPDPPGFAGGRVPVVLQQERSECGLACLAMVAGAYGRKVRLAELRDSMDGYAHGCTLIDVGRIARRLELVSRAVRIEPADLPKLRLPAILHWQMNHFVVVTDVRGRWVRIHDPAEGSRRVNFDEIGRAFTGVAMELHPGRDFRQSGSNRQPGVLRLAGATGWLVPYICATSFLLLGSQMLALAPPIATQILIDEVVLGQERTWLYRAAAGLAVVMLTGVAMDTLRGWIQLYAGTRLATDSTTSLLAHVLRLPVQFVERRHLGDILSRLESLTPIRQALTTDVARFASDLFMLLTSLALMLVYSGSLTTLSVCGLLATLLLLATTLPRTRRLGRELLTRRAAEHSSLVETFRSYETVRSLGLSDIRRLNWQDCFLDSMSTSVGQGKLTLFRSCAGAIIGTVEQVAFLIVGIGGIMEGSVTVGVMFAFVSLRSRFSTAAAGITDTIQRFAVLKVHGERVGDLALAQPESPDPDCAIRQRIDGHLRARNLSFSYATGRTLIDGFGCDIEAGAHAVITGPSGCGKTTLLKLLAGLIEPSSGEIRLDGVEMSLWSKECLRDDFGIVSQNDRLFRGSLVDNISAFAPVPDLRRVREAANIAAVWQEIQQLPMSIHTNIGDSGIALSGGQIQRLVIARAVYRRPRILFLDEATSQLDLATEERVLTNIAAMNITVISVAHRPGAIRSAGQVIVLGHT